ncbi:MAG: hypothetical protein AABX93_02950 [Nanoarchaeota archaeon]
MCGSCVNVLDMVVSDSGNLGGLELQVVSAHGVKTSSHKDHKHEGYDKSGNYQEGPDYHSMNPEYILNGPFMKYSGAANNDNYSPIQNYSQEESSNYAKAA